VSFRNRGIRNDIQKEILAVLIMVKVLKILNGILAFGLACQIAASPFTAWIAGLFVPGTSIRIALQTRAIQTDGTFLTAFLSRGWERTEQGDYSKASEDFLSVLKREPGHTQARYALGELNRELGDLDTAIRYYSDVITLDPTHPWAYRGRSRAFKENGQLLPSLMDESRYYYHSLDPDNAMRLLNRICESYPGQSPAFELRATIKMQSGDTNGAISDYGRTIQNSPGYAWAYYHRASAHLKNNDNSRAILDLENAVSIDPNFSEAYTLLADIQNSLNQKDMACLYYFMAGESHVRWGRLHQARECLDRIRDIDSNSPHFESLKSLIK